MIANNFKNRFHRKIELKFRRKYNFEYDPRSNPIGINMIGVGLYSQLFRNICPLIDSQKLEKSVKELLVNNLLKEEKEFIQNLNFPLPKLRGKTIEDHFYELGYEYSLPYIDLANKLTKSNEIILPKEWAYTPGWVKYNPDGGYMPIEYPTCDALLFDVETCVRRNNMPVMAVAISDKYVYSWVSKQFYEDETPLSCDGNPTNMPLNHLIPIGASDTAARLVIGHHVSFDRSYIKEEYFPTPNFMNFLDTMSIHICIAGYAEAQRTFLNKKRVEDKKAVNPGEETDDSPFWIDQGSFNSLEALSQYYLKQKINKNIVNTFIKGDFQDIRQQFQDLMQYCANDVLTTRKVFTKMWPEFMNTASHPITLSGMMMLSKCYLPLTERWIDFIEDSESIYNNYQKEMNSILQTLSHQALKTGLTNDSYKNDPWLRDLNWQASSFNKNQTVEKNVPRCTEDFIKHNQRIKTGKNITREAIKATKTNNFAEYLSYTDYFADFPDSSLDMFDEKSCIGYPKWYSELTKCSMTKEHNITNPHDLSHSARLIPLILKLSWRGFPILYHIKHQWCFILPKKLVIEGVIDVYGSKINDPNFLIPYNIIKDGSSENKDIINHSQYDDYVEKDLYFERIFAIYPDEDYPEFRTKEPEKSKNKFLSFNNKISVYEDVSGTQLIVPIPHPQGRNKLCGNPLGGDYYEYFLNGVIVPTSRDLGMRYIQLSSPISFWRNNRDRIFDLLSVYFDSNEIPNEFKNHSGIIGCHIPRVISAGTVTRRAVERTWLTVINPKIDTIGSEFKSAIMAPDGFCFVGADVDSEEMWIASLISDASTVGIHGATPFSYMSVRGTKKNESDLHTITAKAVGINRDDAKILNYGRLYGAGIELVRRLIKQYQPNLSNVEAAMKAIYLYNFTKGIRCYELTDLGKRLQKGEISKDLLSIDEFNMLMKSNKIKKENYPIYGRNYWQGGTESDIFNILEQFAYSKNCRTPFLGVSIPTSLSLNAVGDEFLTSRMNWVIQSSAVDFLHVFLICTYWLFSLLRVPSRLCICVHDEIRFLVPEDKRYLAAIALHIGNLFTRSAFSQKLGIYDLPESCAFFSSVDIDKVLRKDPNIDCRTPSNPQGIGKIINGFKCESLSIRQTLAKVGTDIFTDQKLRNLSE